MKFLNYLWLLLFAASCFSAGAQGIPVFKNGDRVVFVGNSITHGGRYHQYIWLYYMTRFPGMPITILNAGIGGEIAGQMNKRLETDVYAKKPSVIALTFGMNDTGYFEFLQSDSATKSKEKLERSYQALLQMDAALDIVIVHTNLAGSIQADGCTVFQGERAAFAATRRVFRAGIRYEPAYANEQNQHPGQAGGDRGSTTAAPPGRPPFRCSLFGPS